MKTKLMEELEAMKPDQNIKIGCTKGTGYFYVGNASHLMAHMEEYEHLVAAKIEERYKKANDDLEQIRESLKQKLNYDAFSLATVLASASRKADNYLKARKAIDKVIYLRDREVKDKFPADPTVEHDCLIVMIDGSDSGTYWTKSEAPDGIGFGLYGSNA